MNRDVFKQEGCQPSCYFCAERCNMKPDNKRCLCNKCADDYTSAGYVLTRTHKEYTDGCERCNWHLAHEYKIKPKS